MENTTETIEIDIVGGKKEIEIFTTGSWHNFYVDDEVYFESQSSNYRSTVCKVCKVIGFNMLYGMFLCDTVYEEKYFCATSPIGIILFRRDSGDFFVSRNHVIGISGKVTDKVGRIVALNPERINSTEYLVKFRSYFEDGHDGRCDWDKPWYPKKYKVKDAKNLYWCLREQIDFY